LFDSRTTSISAIKIREYEKTKTQVAPKNATKRFTVSGKYEAKATFAKYEIPSRIINMIKIFLLWGNISNACQTLRQQ